MNTLPGGSTMTIPRLFSIVLLGLWSTLWEDASQADALQLASPLGMRPVIAIKRHKNDPMDFASRLAHTTSSLFQSDRVFDTISLPEQTTLIKERIDMLPEQFLKTRSFLQRGFHFVGEACSGFLKNCWWSFPMTLALIPVYTSVVHKVLPVMPGWWPLTSMDRIISSPSAQVIVTLFLSSNVFYLASGLYLLCRFGPIRENAKSSLKGYPLLGGMVLTAGAVSTIFHAYQALGSFSIAQALCYIDHAVAISSILYFWHRCGRPGPIASTLSVLGLLALAITDPWHIYPWMHSTWHGLSAAAAVAWAHDGAKRRIFTNVKPTES